MRILYFHQYFATRRRSTATRSYELARRLVERGHQVTIVSRDTRSLEHDRTEAPRGRLIARETVDGIDVLFISMPYSNYFGPAARVASFAGFTVAASIAGLMLPKPDVVFASSTPLTIGIPGLLVSRLKDVPFVFEIRDLWPAVPVALGALRGRPLIALAERLERLLYREARRVVVLSEGSGAALVKMGVPAEKLVFVPNASDLDLFQPDVREPGFRARHGLEGKLVALYSGAMGRANGLDQLLDAAAVLKHEGIEDVAFVAVGEGAAKPRLLQRVADEGLDNVLFLPPVAKTALAGIVGAADVTLTLFAPYPVLQTNSPNKLFDSLAAGRPVIVNLDGWLRRVVEEAGAGVYVPAGDGEALATTLAALAREPGLVATMGANARSLAEREFDRDVMADRLAEALEEAAGHREAADRATTGHAAPAGHAADAECQAVRHGAAPSVGAGPAPSPPAVPDDVDAAVPRPAEESADA
jgi:glycosyltransferase involved in cell wall biosynthesis